MEDLNALYSALEKADAAGDVESAKALTKYIQSLPAEEESTLVDEPIAAAQQPLKDIRQPPTAKPDDNSSDFFRGMRTYGPETKATLYGAEALLGKQIGSEKLVRAGVKGYEEASKELAPLAKDTDTIQGAIDKGISAVVTDFLPYWAGKGVGMIGEGLAFSALGGLFGTAAAPGIGTAGGAITGLVSKSLVEKGLKEAVAKIAKEKGDDAAKEFIKKEATKFMASEEGKAAVKKEIGRRVGIGAMAGIHGEGEVMSQAIDHATQTIADPEERIKAVQDLSTGRLTTAAAGHALGDYFATKIGLDALDNLAGPTKNFIMSVVKNWALTGAKEVPPELLQTALERFGADMPLGDKEAINDYINTAAASFGMSAIPGGYGGVKGAIQARKTTEAEKDIDTEPAAEEKRGSRETLIKSTLQDLEDKANEVNRVKEEEAAKLKSAQAKQVVSEAQDLESMAPVKPTELTDTTLTSWGLSKNSKAYKTLIGQDVGTPEGRALLEDTLDAHTGKINEPAVETYKNLLDQQKAEATDARTITGTATVGDEILGGQVNGIARGTQGRYGSAVDLSGSLAGITQTGEGAGNAPLETKKPTEPVTKIDTTKKSPLPGFVWAETTNPDGTITSGWVRDKNAPAEVKEAEAPTSTEVLKGEEALTETKETKAMKKMAGLLRTLDPSNSLIESLENGIASNDDIVEAHDTIESLKEARKAKKVDLTKTSEEEKDLPQEARGEIQETGETPETIEQSFQNQYGKNVRLAKQRGLLNFLNDVSELPPEVGPVTPGTKAVFHKGKGYFITNRITKEDAPRMLLHEIGAHYGLEGMLGTNNYKRVVRSIKQNKITDKDIKAAWENTVKTYPEYPEGSDYFMQEVIARIGETAPNNSIFRQIVGYIKQFLSKLGYGWNVDNITADDIRDMVQHSVRVSLAGKVKGAQTETTLAETKVVPTFYSQLIKELNALPKRIKSMDAEQWRMWLNKRVKRNIKEEEAQYSNIRKLLEQTPSKVKISKDELLKFVTANIPKIDIVQLGGAESPELSKKLDKVALKRQIGVDNARIASNKLRNKLIASIPNARYRDIVTELPEGWKVKKRDDGRFHVVSPEGIYHAIGITPGEAVAWTIHDYLAPQRREQQGGRGNEWVGTKDGVNIEQLMARIKEDVQDEAQEANPDNTEDYAERMEALNLAHQYAPQELDEYYGQYYAMRKSQEEFNKAVEQTRENARFLQWTLEGEREGDVNFSLVFNPEGKLVYMAPQLHSMGDAADKNRIVHIRGNIRTNINGEKVLFIEEIQSDWGQKAYDTRQKEIKYLKEEKGLSDKDAKLKVPKDYGFKKVLTQDEETELETLKASKEQLERQMAMLDYTIEKAIEDRDALLSSYTDKDILSRNPSLVRKKLEKIVKDGNNARKKRTKLLDELITINNLIKDFQDSSDSVLGHEKVNRGPYVANTKAWVTLALKQIFRYAADQGLNKVMFINGQQSAERYNLSQVIDSIHWSKRSNGKYNLEGYKNNRNRVTKYGLTSKDIIEHFGQDVLSEITKQEAKLYKDPVRSNLLNLRKNLENDIEEHANHHIVMRDWLTLRNYSIEEASEILSSYKDMVDIADDSNYVIEELKHFDIPLKEINKFVTSLIKLKKSDKLYSDAMKKHGFEDLSNPIADTIDVHEMETNARGKGMKDFYNNIVPQAIRDYVKRLGGGEIFETNLINMPVDRDGVVQTQLQVTLSPKAMEAASSPQPLFARMSEEELDRQLAESGNQSRPKVTPPSFKDNLMAHPIQTMGDVVRNLRKSGFSFDHAINQKIIAAMRKANLSVEELAKSFYQMQISQAVKSDQMADLFMIHGDLNYDSEAFKFVVSDVRDSMTSIRDKLKALAIKHNVPEHKMYQYASAAFIARRSQGLLSANKALKKRVLKLLVDGKKAQAEKLMKRNYKLVHLTPAEIKKGEKFFNDFKDSNGKSELEKLFSSWNKNRARVLNFAQEQGLYSEEDIDDLLNVMDYVPFFRDEQIEAGKGPKEYARGLLDAAADKRLKGSYQPVNNVFDNMERWTRYVIRKSINNRAAQEKIKLYSKWVPDDIKILRGKERSKTGNIVNVWQGGKLVKYEFEGTDGASMVDGFTGLEPVMTPFLRGALRPYANFLRLNIVLQPIFSIAQIPMDTFNAMFTSQVRYPLAIPIQVIKEIMLTPFGKSAARNYLKTTGTVGKHDFSSEYERIDIDAMKEAKQAGSATKLLKKIMHPLSMLAMASDNVIRQAVYSQVMLETKDKARAVHMAEEIINFRRTGSSGLVNTLRQNAPFVNANLQSLHVAFSTLLDSGIGPDAHGKAFKRLITTGAQMFVLSMIYAILNADDDKYKELDPSERDRYLIIPGTNGFKFPLRNDIITLLFKTIPEHLVNRFIKESEDSEKMLHSLKVGLARALALPSALPTVISPIVESAYNIDLNTGRPIVGKGQENLEEDLQYSNKYTMQLSRVMGDATGTAPATIQHFFDRYFGTTSLLLGLVTNNLIASMRNEILPEKSIREYLLQLPSMSSFVAKEHGARNINDYYELNDIVSKITASAKRYEKLDYKKYQEYLAKDHHAEIINMQREMNAISKQLQILRDYENRIYASTDTARWTPESKKAELDRIEGVRQNMLGSQLKLKDRTDRYIQQLRYRAGL